MKFTSPPSRQDFHERVWKLARMIPRGQVATYGQVAALAGIPGRARQVGYALHALPEGSDVPWHRVINARGTISPRADGDAEICQQMLLQSEGIDCTLSGQDLLRRYQWFPTPTATT